jgi:hypothetical protein
MIKNGSNKMMPIREQIISKIRFNKVLYLPI